MSKHSPRLLLLLVSFVLFACGGPTPIIVQPSTSTDAAVVATNPEGVEATEVAFENDPDPGPIPVQGDDPRWGSRKALVTLVEFADFQCPYCGKAQATLAMLQRAYGPRDLRIIWKNNPLSFHKDARPAADMAMAVFERSGSKAFWAFHDYVFEHQAELGHPGADAVLAGALRQAGIDRADFSETVRSRARQKIDADIELAKSLSATGTPTFFINGVIITGSQSIDKFKEVIDAQLQKAKTTLAAGTPDQRLYAVLAKEQWSPPKPKDPPPDEVVDPRVWSVPVGKSPVRGKASALVTVVEFGDFQCPFCARVQQTLNQLPIIYGDKLRLVFKHEPLVFHARSEPAAQLAIEARVQKGDAAFWEVHDALFADQQNLDDQSLEALAKRLGLNAGTMAAVAKHKNKAIIDVDQNLADDLDATATPSFFVNGRHLVGAQPLEKFKALIDEELAKAEAMVTAGTAPEKVYDAIMKTATANPAPPKVVIAAPPKDSPSLGAANARVVVQVFADFQCPFCKRLDPTLADLEKEFHGKVRVVWRHLPLAMHANAELASEAAVEAFKQKGDKGFWAMHDLLMAGQDTPGGLERSALLGYAAQIGLDGTKFVAALDGGTNKARVEVDSKVAAGASITATPTVVINGYEVSGVQPIGKFRKVVRRAISELK